MAAIIAQMSLANRERKKQKAEMGNKSIGADKCIYCLPPFDRCFDPMKHNKYMKMKQQIDRRNYITNAAKCKYNMILANIGYNSLYFVFSTIGMGIYKVYLNL